MLMSNLSSSVLSNKLYPTVTEAMTALKLADGSSPETTETTTMQTYLDRMAVASPRLSGHILTRKTALGSYDYVISGEPKEKAAEAQLRLSKVITKLVQESANASLFGCFCIELEWSLIENKWQPTVKKIFKPYEIEKAPNGSLFLLSIEGGRITKTDIMSMQNSQNYIWAVDSASWHGGSMRSVIFHEILRNDTLKEWANYNKKLKGIIQAKAPEDEKADASTALKTIAENNYSVTSKDVEFLVNEMTSSKGVDSFKEFKNELENDIAIAILGQANTTQLPSGGGSRAALQILNMIRADIHFSDMMAAKSIINDQLLKYDYQLNTDQNAVQSPFSFDFVHDEAGDVEANSRAIEAAVRIGVPLLASEVYEKLGMRQPQAGDELLTVKQNSPF